MILYWGNGSGTGEVSDVVYGIYSLTPETNRIKQIVHLKELEHVYQNTSNEALFDFIRNDVHIKSA